MRENELVVSNWIWPFIKKANVFLDTEQIFADMSDERLGTWSTLAMNAYDFLGFTVWGAEDVWAENIR